MQVTLKDRVVKFKRAIPWLVVALVLAGLWAAYRKAAPPTPLKTVSYSQLLAEVRAGQVKAISLQGEHASVTYRDAQVLPAIVPLKETELLPAAVSAGTQVLGVTPPAESELKGVAMNWGPLLLLFAVLIYMARKRAGANNAGSGLMSVGKSKARLLTAGESTVTFADIAGCDEAKLEVTELVDFLREPAKFERLGARIPRGVLLEGPPGTGKTSLAKAIAGEAKVPFFLISGADFVEMLVGVGAARVRDMFATAKKHAPCIVFIDEIDAVGRQRGSGQGGGSDEREQTLNQLLVEMDGFEPGAGVIVLAATNRAETLDSALLRPGRFDRQVTLALPDVRGREQILNVHLRKVPAQPDICIETLAKGTPGFSGADLANLVNEAALRAARSGHDHVGMGELEAAKDKLLMGPEKHSMRMSQQEKSVTAFHEAGHTLIAKLLKHTDPIHKVSVIPRGRALGVTVQLPASDRYSLGKLRIQDSIAMLFGGRVAEELFTDDVTTGASNDYERATQYARSMVMQWGMSDEIGPRVVAAQGGSPDTLKVVDAEIKRILEQQYARVTTLLTKHADAIHALHAALMEHETLDLAQVDAIVSTQASKPDFASC